MIIGIDVTGDPKGQPRPRLARNGRVFTPPVANEWRRQIGKAISDETKAKASRVLGKPCVIYMAFKFERPKSHRTKRDTLAKGAPTYHASKPDIDNLIKPVLDVLVEQRIFTNDSQVYGCIASKQWGKIKEHGGVAIRIIYDEEAE